MPCSSLDERNKGFIYLYLQKYKWHSIEKLLKMVFPCEFLYRRRFWDESTAKKWIFNKKCGTLLEKSRNLEATEAITVYLSA
jgi:hypothetical protein